MKALGKTSLSSFLVVLVNVGWYCVALALVVTLLFLVAGSPVGVQIDAGLIDLACPVVLLHREGQLALDLVEL